MTRRAKIVCTLGPAVDSIDALSQLAQAGMNVARFNLSHGDHAEHERRFHQIRQVAERTGRPIGILFDLQGPKIRLGEFPGGPALLEPGAPFTITTRAVPGNEHLASTTFAGLPRDVSPGDAVLIDDGRVALRCESVDAEDVNFVVEVGGTVSDHKGINLPGVPVSVPALTAKDIEDLRFGLRLGADLIALSFVRGPDDVLPVRKIMTEEGIHRPVIAKVEKPQAVDRLEEVVDAFDGIMVARGDLGVEMPLEQVPAVQKRAIALCRVYAKPVIVATQMLDSMISEPRPTRAEVSDVANAILDGTDAVMLSGETSVGAHAIEAADTMSRIIAEVERTNLDSIPQLKTSPRSTRGVVCASASYAADAIGVDAIVLFTQTGDTAYRLSRLRKRVPLFAFTPDPVVRDRLALAWGVQPYVIPMVNTSDEMVQMADRLLVEKCGMRDHDTVIVVGGNPPGIAGTTNSLRVHEVGGA